MYNAGVLDPGRFSKIDWDQGDLMAALYDFHELVDEDEWLLWLIRKFQMFRVPNLSPVPIEEVIPLEGGDLQMVKGFFRESFFYPLANDHGHLSVASARPILDGEEEKILEIVPGTSGIFWFALTLKEGKNFSKT